MSALPRPLPPVLRSLAAPASVVLIVVAFFWRLVLTTDQLYLRDSMRMSLPMRFFGWAEYLSGRTPLWFPYDGSGVAFVGQLATGVFHPLNAVYAVAGFARAYQLNYLGAFVLGGIGTFFFARLRGGSRLASACAGVGYALAGAVSSQSNLTFLAGNASFACALAGLAFFFAKPGPYRALVASLCLALPLFAGEPQAFAVAGLFAGLDALGQPSSKAKVVRLGALAALTLGAVLLAAIQLWPAVETLLDSARLNDLPRSSWAFPPVRSLELFAPNILDEGVRSDLTELLYQRNYPWAPRVFLGPFVVAAAFLGARKATNRALVLAALLCLWLSFGPSGGLDELFAAVVPAWKGFRYGEKMVAFLSFALAVLAGDGVDALLERPRAAVDLLYAAGAFAVAGLACAVLSLFALPYGEAALYLNTAPRVGGAALLVLVVAGLARVAPPRALPPLLAAAFVVPLFAFNLDGPKYLAAEELFVKPWAADVVLNDHRGVEPPRICSVERMGLLAQTGDETLSGNLVARSLLLPDYSAIFGIESFASYLPLKDRYYQQAVGVGNDLLYGRLLPIFAVEYVVVADTTVELPAAWSLLATEPNSKLRVFRADERIPRVYVPRNAEQQVGDDAIKRLLQPELFPLDTVVTDCALSADETTASVRGEARIAAWSTQQVTIAARMAQPGFVVLNDALRPGWEAYVDEQQVPICRANGMMRAVRVPPGEHTVQFVYAPSSFLYGMTTSFGVVALWLVTALVLRRRVGRAEPRQPDAVPSPPAAAP